jgi:hypothetical protein
MYKNPAPAGFGVSLKTKNFFVKPMHASVKSPVRTLRFLIVIFIECLRL